MDSQVSIGVFNTQPDQREAFREAIRQLNFVDLVLETSSWEELEQSLLEGTMGVLLVNLDDNVEYGKQIAQRALRAVPNLGVIGVSARTDPQTIISAMRAGCTQFVCAPIEQEDFRNAVERIRATRVATPVRSRRICVVGASGGVGGTMIACNLAMELSQVTRRTSALVDLNLEYGDAAFSFDCEPKYSLADLCDGGSPIDRTMVESAAHQLPCDVALLSRPSKVSDARSVTPEGVEQTLRVLGSMYPHVVIDLPRSFSFLSSVAIGEADLIMIVTQLSIPSVRNASRVYDLLLDMGAPEESIEIVLNRCRAEHQRVNADDVERHFRRPIFALIPNDYRRVTAALDFGHPMMADAPNSPARLAIHEMAKTIASDGKPGDDPAAPALRKSGIFQRWLGGTKRPPSAIPS